MRQLAIGYAIYAGDNRGIGIPGRMPNISPAANVYPVGNGLQWRPRWHVTMGASAGFHAYNEPDPKGASDNTKHVDHPVFTCPSAPQHTNNRNFTFGYNFQFLGNSRPRSSDPSRFINFPVRADSVSGQTVLFADALGTAAHFAEADRTPYRPDGVNEPTAVGNHAWSLDPPRLTATSDSCHDGNGQRSAPDPRHNARSNFAFTDGHIKTRPPDKMGYIMHGDGRFAFAGAETHNRLFSGTGRDDDPPNR